MARPRPQILNPSSRNGIRKYTRSPARIKNNLTALEQIPSRESNSRSASNEISRLYGTVQDSVTGSYPEPAEHSSNSDASVILKSNLMLFSLY
jgi:hypothetical protein